MHCAQGFNTLLYLRHREACITQDEARRSRGRHGLRHGPQLCRKAARGQHRRPRWQGTVCYLGAQKIVDSASGAYGAALTIGRLI